MFLSLAFGIVQNTRVPAIPVPPHRLDIFAFYSPILGLVFHAPTSGPYAFVIACKGCRQNIPAPVETMLDTWIIAKCLLCGHERRYLPNDIFQGRLSHEFLAKSRRTGGKEWAR